LNESAIEVSELSKHFGDKVVVDKVAFKVRHSEIFGFLGPNGARKTTTIKILTTFIPASAGYATVLGYDLKNEGKKIRGKIGVVQQQDSFDQGLNLETSMNIYGLL
jgi:ABC-2 type transport system ATP-binding protein